MNGRILCPYHEERTPSFVLYEDHGHCFSCGVSASRDDLQTVYKGPWEPDPEVQEDLGESITRIRSLPKKYIRGLGLHSDDFSYFIVWPDSSYYKRRFLDSKGPKYIGAKGHKKPPFVASANGETLVIVEGELNAMSIAAACPDLSVVSPGGCGDFRHLSKWLTSCQLYHTILVVADRDAPGAEACIEAMSQLQGKVPRILAHLMPKDANEILVNDGPEKLRQEIDRVLGSGMEKST